MTDTVKEEIERTNAKKNPWYRFLQASLELDWEDELYNIQPYGWHWFWGIYHLHEKLPAFPKIDLNKIKRELPNEHWIHRQGDEDRPYSSKLPDSHAKDDAASLLHKFLQEPNSLKTIKEIDFEKLEFLEYADFSNLIFPARVSFHHTEFSQNANFSQTRFHEQARFTYTIFHAALLHDKTSNSMRPNNANFENAEFFNSALFGSTTFKTKSNFQKVKFLNGGNFHSANFFGEANFDETKFYSFPASFEDAKFCSNFGVFFRKALFSSGAFFHNTKFNGVVDFDEAIFTKGVFFDDADFSNHVNFRHAKITEYTSFSNAKFKKNIPLFYGAKLHPDTAWNNTKWPILTPPINSDDIEEYNKTLQQNRNAYEHLSYQMEKLGKYHDQHFFFRQEMRCRKKLGSGFNSFIYRVYEVFADYGYGVGNAFAWWLGHIIAGGLFLFIAAYLGCFKTSFDDFACAFGVSLANAHGFFFMGGRLGECYGVFENLPFFTAIWVTQVILGIPLLFILGLTLRVRFRLR